MFCTKRKNHLKCRYKTFKTLLVAVDRQVFAGSGNSAFGALRSENPRVLFDKWRRFEVFAHSKNRVRIDQADENRVQFLRYAVGGGTPTAPENLLICGLIIGLLEAIGCVDLWCEMG